MVDIVVSLTENEYKGLSYIAVDPQEWIENLAKARAAAAIQEIYEAEIVRMTNDPDVTSIPANKDVVVSQAVIKTAAERQSEFLLTLPVESAK